MPTVDTADKSPVIQQSTQHDGITIKKDNHVLSPIESHQSVEYGSASTPIMHKEVILSDDSIRKKPKKWTRANFIFRSTMYGSLTLGLNFSTAFIVATLIPIQVMEMVGVYNKEAAMTIVAIVGAIIPSFTGMITGYLSDHNMMQGIKSRLGKRKPFMLFGTFLWMISIMLRSWIYFRGNWSSSNHQFLFFLYCCVSTLGFLALSIIWVPYNALMQDVFPKQRFGTVSGVSGFLGFLGNTLGLGLMGFLYNYVPTMILTSIASGVVFITMLLVLFFVPDDTYQPIEQHVEDQGERILQPVTFRDRIRSAINICYEFLKPFKDWDFAWIFVARLVILCTLNGMQNYFLYYMKDVVGPRYTFIVYDNLIRSAPEAQAVFLAFVVLSSLVSSIGGGIISDRVGRKYVVCVSGMIASIALLAMILVGNNFNLLCLVGIALGLACGSYLAVDLALINEVVADKKDEACKMLGVFAVAGSLAGVLASPMIGGILLIGKMIMANNPAFPIANFGYVLTYGLCSVTCMIASIMILFMKKGGAPKRRRTRRLKKPSQAKTESQQELDNVTISTA